uniref:Uncharacterized protein n=1 Tax=Wuchereria bancrofti TaxID=6293 RepID=A0A1I8ES14_WUCBA
MDDQTKLLVGLVCSDEELVEYYVQLITEIKRFTLKAIWCPDTERSIDIAADNDVPSVSHTAFQLISRNDINTVVIAGHAAHSALFCMQAQEATFEQPHDAKHRLYNECNTVLHQVSHEIVDTLSTICGCNPIPIATTCHQRSSLVEHFRLQELQYMHMQIAFSNTVASIRFAGNTTKTLVLRINGELGFFQLDPRMLILEGCGDRRVMWRGDGTMESIIRTGTVKALENCDCNKLSTDVNELSLVQCVSICRFI